MSVSSERRGLSSMDTLGYKTEDSDRRHEDHEIIELKERFPISDDKLRYFLMEPTAALE